MNKQTKILIAFTIVSIFLLPNIFLLISIILLMLVKEYELAFLFAILSDIMLLPHDNLLQVYQFQFTITLLIAASIWFIANKFLFNKVI